MVFKYIFSVLLVIWGIITLAVKLFFEGLHFPFLTVFTLMAIALGINKNKKSNLVFFISASFWILMSAETIGFVIFFDSGNYERMLIGIIPLFLGIGLMLSTKNKEKRISFLIKKGLVILFLTALGISSYVYKTSTEEINCWYHFEDEESYKVVFASSPKHKFEVILSSQELKKEVKKEAIKYENIDGYYCPETKVRVVTYYGKIISAKIISFRNSETDKNITFSHQVKIPLNEVKGEVEILKPYLLRIWS